MERPRRASRRTVAVAYAALRGPGEFGDDAVRAVQGVAADAARALRLADGAAVGRDTAVAAERQRMQASLHDSVGAMLFSIGAQVRDLRSTLPDNPLLRTRLGRLESDVSAASWALREALLALSESSPERALPIELAEHCRSFEARTGVPARFVQLGDVRPLDVERTTLLIGAVREGLLNVEKHAEAEHRGGQPRRGRRRGAGRGGRRRAPATAPRRAGRQRAGHPAAGGEGGPARRRVSLVHDEDGGYTLRMLLPPGTAGRMTAARGDGGRRPPGGPRRRGAAAAGEPALVVVGSAESGRAAIERAPELRRTWSCSTCGCPTCSRRRS